MLPFGFVFISKGENVMGCVFNLTLNLSTALEFPEKVELCPFDFATIKSSITDARDWFQIILGNSFHYLN